MDEHVKQQAKIISFLMVQKVPTMYQQIFSYKFLKHCGKQIFLLLEENNSQQIHFIFQAEQTKNNRHQQHNTYFFVVFALCCLPMEKNTSITKACKFTHWLSTITGQSLTKWTKLKIYHGSGVGWDLDLTYSLEQRHQDCHTKAILYIP